MISGGALTESVSNRSMLCFPPAAMAATAPHPAGISISPWPSSPQAATVPSDFSARLWLHPAEIDTTLVKPSGGSIWPDQSAPQATTVPSDFNARL